jgi:hypothetical protein
VAPRRKVTPESVADAIADVERPFASTGDLSERLDVTKQAIRNRHEELVEHDRIEYGQIGRTKVYWIEQQPPAQPPSSGPPGQHTDTATESDGKGLIERIFTTLPHWGSSAEVWFLTGLVASLGLLVGVAFSTVVFRPSPEAATTAALAVLALAVSVSVPIALYYILGGFRQAVGENT